MYTAGIDGKKEETKKEKRGNGEEREVQGEERDCPKIIASRHVRQNDPSVFMASKYTFFIIAFVTGFLVVALLVL